MLRIKQNVDLSELEKFGYRFNGFVWLKMLSSREYSYKTSMTKGIQIFPSGNIRYKKCDESAIQDLRDANLVDKVEENGNG